MDLNEIMASEDPVWVTLENPVTFEPMTNAKGDLMQVQVLGPDTQPARMVEKKIASNMLKQMTSGRRGRVEITPEMQEQQARMRFMARVAGWRNLTLDGKAFAYNDENKAKFYDEPRFGPLVRQLQAAMNDDSLFIGQTTSPLD